jgi:hypothetical protein
MYMADGPSMRPIAARFPLDECVAIFATAAKEGLPVSALIRRAVRAELDRLAQPNEE